MEFKKEKRKQSPSSRGKKKKTILSIFLVLNFTRASLLFLEIKTKLSHKLGFTSVNAPRFRPVAFLGKRRKRRTSQSQGVDRNGQRTSQQPKALIRTFFIRHFLHLNQTRNNFSLFFLQSDV